MTTEASKNPLDASEARDYSEVAAETTAVGFGDLSLKADDDRRMAVFFRLYTTHASSSTGGRWWGYPRGYAGCLECRFANPIIRPPTPFGDGGRVQHSRIHHVDPSFCCSLPKA